MFYAVIVPTNCDNIPPPEELVFEKIKDAASALKSFKGSRMKTFKTKEKALDFVKDPVKDESFMEDASFSDLSESLEKLTINSKQAGDTSGTGEAGAGNGGAKGGDVVDKYVSITPGLLNQLRRTIEKGECGRVEEIIWSNPKYLVTVCDSAVYLMAGPKYNACHIAARANKPDIMALLLDTVSNISFMRKLYPDEADTNVQDRVNHLLDSYLNTPDSKQGNTPLHFACKLGHYRVVRVLLTFEGCDLNLKDSAGRTAEESICLQCNIDDDNASNGGDSAIAKKIKNMFKCQLHLPLHRDQLKKRLLMEKRRNKAKADSDTSFSDDSFTLLTSPIKESNNLTTRISTLASPTMATNATETMNKYH